jgi:hypothetical protein
LFYSIPLERRTALNDLFFLLSLSMEMVCIILTLRQASLHYILNRRQNHNSVFLSQWWHVCILQFFIPPSLFARFKGIDHQFRGGVESTLIRSLLVNWRLGYFLNLILKGLLQKISKNHLTLLNNFESHFDWSKPLYADFCTA